ncbi:MAG: response regulator [Anaerolineae bacterium]|jgi:CheY-like chemotaxis protein|nr:response regulator [Anaerolineae bacterium]
MTTLDQNTLKGWIVVVIDDEDDSLFVATHMLRHYGATVHTAQNGQDGLEAIRTHRPRFVISDISMPIMDGWDLIEQLQTDIALREIPVIALTAHAMFGDRERAIAAGFYNYLTKPLTPATFIHDLLRLLVKIPEFAELLPQP